jgi:hypothetical protein
LASFLHLPPGTTHGGSGGGGGTREFLYTNLPLVFLFFF